MANTGNSSLRIVDGFYEDPMAIRFAALNATWVDAWGSWSGLHSLERATDTKSQLFRIASMVSDSLPNWEELDASYQFWKKASCGGFAVTFSGQSGIIHAHRRSGDWAGVVYLTSQRECEGRDGTIFFQHRETGLTHYTSEDDPLFLKACADAHDRGAWDVTEVVPMRFNRLVLFDSHYFHGASEGFGSTICDGRLIQVFNFSFVEAA